MVSVSLDEDAQATARRLNPATAAIVMARISLSPQAGYTPGETWSRAVNRD